MRAELVAYFSLLNYSSTLKKEAIYFSETLGSRHTTWRYNPETHTLYPFDCSRIIKYGRNYGNTWLKSDGAFLQRSVANTSKEVTNKPNMNRIQSEKNSNMAFVFGGKDKQHVGRRRSRRNDQN
jgi:hypothetical protein